MEIIDKLKEAGVPSGPINNIAQVLSHPQVLHRGMVQEVEHPTIGTLKLLGIPVTLSDTPGSVRMAPPLLSQHTEEVLMGLNYGNEDIAHFRAKGVI